MNKLTRYTEYVCINSQGFQIVKVFFSPWEDHSVWKGRFGGTKQLEPSQRYSDVLGDILMLSKIFRRYLRDIPMLSKIFRSKRKCSLTITYRTSPKRDMGVCTWLTWLSSFTVISVHWCVLLLWLNEIEPRRHIQCFLNFSHTNVRSPDLVSFFFN